MPTNHPSAYRRLLSLSVEEAADQLDNYTVEELSTFLEDIDGRLGVAVAKLRKRVEDMLARKMSEGADTPESRQLLAAVCKEDEPVLYNQRRKRGFPH